MHYFVGSRSFKVGNSLKEILWEETQRRYVLDKILGSPFPFPGSHSCLCPVPCLFSLSASSLPWCDQLLTCFCHYCLASPWAQGQWGYGLWTKFLNCVPKQILPLFHFFLLGNNSMRKITALHFLSSMSFCSLCDSDLPQYPYYLIFRYR